MLKTNSTLFFFFLTQLLLANSVLAQDRCQDILSRGVFNKFLRSSNQSSTSALAREACSKNSGKVVQDRANKLCTSSSDIRSMGASARASYSLFSGSGSYSSFKSFQKKYCKENKSFDLNKWRNERCSASSKNATSNRVRYSLIQKASKSIVDAWKKCMLRRTKDLICWAKNDGNRRVIFYFAWDNRFATKLKTKFVKSDNLLWKSSLPGYVSLGDTFLLARRKDQKDATITLKVTNKAGTTASCLSQIPSIQLPAVIRLYTPPRRRTSIFPCDLFQRKCYRQNICKLSCINKEYGGVGKGKCVGAHSSHKIKVVNNCKYDVLVKIRSQKSKQTGHNWHSRVFTVKPEKSVYWEHCNVSGNYAIYSRPKRCSYNFPK